MGTTILYRTYASALAPCSDFFAMHGGLGSALGTQNSIQATAVFFGECRDDTAAPKLTYLFGEHVHP